MSYHAHNEEVCYSEGGTWTLMAWILSVSVMHVTADTDKCTELLLDMALKHQTCTRGSNRVGDVSWQLSAAADHSCTLISIDSVGAGAHFCHYWHCHSCKSLTLL